MNQQIALNIAAAVLVLAWVVSRQLQARPVRENRPFTLMLVLAAAGLYQMAQLAGRTSVSDAAWAALAAGLASGALFGWLRGRTMHLWRADGVLTRQGNLLTVVLWVSGIAVHIGLEVAGAALSPADAGAKSLGGAGVLVYLAVTLAVQRLATLDRARRLDGAAPISAH